MQEFLIVAGAHIVAAMSPGPDFAVLVKSALTENRRKALSVAAGIAAGVGVHIAYSLLGLAFVISQSIVAFNIIKFMGAAYLIWIGIAALRSDGGSTELDQPAASIERTYLQAGLNGFITNALNPKATLFFLGLFTQVIDPTTGSVTKLLYASEMIVTTFIWFALLATVITRPAVKTVFEKAKNKIDKVVGVVLIALGARVAAG